MFASTVHAADTMAVAAWTGPPTQAVLAVGAPAFNANGSTKAAESAPAKGPHYYSPVARIDPQDGLRVLQFRDEETGKVLGEVPIGKAAQAYETAERRGDQSDRPRQREQSAEERSSLGLGFGPAMAAGPTVRGDQPVELGQPKGFHVSIEA